MVKKAILSIFISIIFFISFVIVFIKDDRKKYLDNEPITILINGYIDKENYNNVIIYSLNNINYITKILDILKYRFKNTNNTVYGIIDKINILETIITLDNSDNEKNYIELQKLIINLSNMDFFSIDEYFSTINIFNNFIKLEKINLDFLEILSKKNIEIIERFIKEYYKNSENINSFVYKKYRETYNNYLLILEKKYSINKKEINNINNLSGIKFEYALAKKNLNKYKNSDTSSLLVPIFKITGKTIIYYHISKFFNNKFSYGLNAFGTLDVGTDIMSLYKKINYSLYSNKIHIKNRENILYMNKFDKVYYLFIKIYYKLTKINNKENNFKKYKIRNDNNSISRIKILSINKAIATISIRSEKNIINKLEKKDNKNIFINFIGENILKNKDNEVLKKELFEKHNYYINKLKFYKNFLVNTCI